MPNRAGHYITNLSGEFAYKSFVPAPLPPAPPPELSGEALNLLVKANVRLAVLETLANRIPNVDLFVSMYVRKEALMSSQIEGTQATLEDIFDPQLETNTNLNVADVVNYVKATSYAVKRLETLPLCNRLIRETHAVLMQGVRGQEKNPGEFRRSQNWIGGQGSTLKNARYIPPSPDDMEEAMSALEKYINEEESELDVLVQAALIHYQFETIHPFLDGNGRIGRLLITLFLLEKKALSTPALYISYYLKRYRIEYYDRMTEVRRSGNYEQWVTFFLQAVLESTDDAIETIDKLSALHDKNAAIIAAMGRAAKNTMLVFEELEANPIIEIRKTAAAIGVTYSTAANAVKRLENAGIVQQKAESGRNRTYLYTEYLDILRNGT